MHLVLEDGVLTTGSPGLSPTMYLFYTQKSELRISSSAWNLQNVAQLSLMPRKGCGRVCPMARARCCGPYKTHPHVWLWACQQHSYWHHGAVPAKRTAGDSLHCHPPPVLSGPEQTFPCYFHLTAKVCGPSDHSRSRNEARCELKLLNPFRNKLFQGSSWHLSRHCSPQGVVGSLSSSASGWKLPPSPSFASPSLTHAFKALNVQLLLKYPNSQLLFAAFCDHHPLEIVMNASGGIKNTATWTLSQSAESESPWRWVICFIFNFAHTVSFFCLTCLDLSPGIMSQTASTH